MPNNWRLHLRYNLIYGGAICLSTVILLLTVKWGSIYDLVQYISFGLTLTSLFLALIAIFYAIISNSSFSQHLGVLRNAADSVAQSSLALNDVSASLDRRVAELPEMIKGIETKVDQTREEIARASAEKTSRDLDRAGEAHPDATALKLMPPSALVQRFVDGSSFFGLLALYSAQLAHEKKIPFVMAVVWADSKLIVEYGHGYLVAAASMGIIDFTTKDDMINVIALHEDLPRLRDRLVRWLEAKHEEAPETWVVERELEKTLKPVEKYFNV